MKKPFLLFCLFLLGMFHSPLKSQELEPGMLSPIPISANIGIASYGISGGGVVLDNSIPIEDLSANLQLYAVGYLRTFKLFNRLTKFDFVQLYGTGTFNGIVEGDSKSVRRSGFGDPSLRISMILVGTDPLKPKDYFSQKPKNFRLGFSFRVKVPLGSYTPEKLINFGGNRWAYRLALAGSYTIKEKLVFELHFTNWWFRENDDFFGGNSRTQDPWYGAQLHATYIFKPGIWLAASVGGANGGAATVNGVETTPQNNRRYGAAFAYRLGKHSSLKLAYTNSLITTLGDDFNTLLLGYQFIWFDKK